MWGGGFVLGFPSDGLFFFCHGCLFLSFQPFLPVFLRSMRSDATVTMACPQSLCLGDVAVCTLWMLFQPPNPTAQWDSHCPRASGAAVGFGYFRLQPKSSTCFLVLETSPSSERGKEGSSPRGSFEFVVSLWLSQTACSPTAPFSRFSRAGVDFPGFESRSFPAILTFQLLSSQQVTGRACPPSDQWQCAQPQG